MFTIFQVMFTIAVGVSIVVVAILCAQVWRQVRRQGPEPQVLDGTDVLYAAASFCGPLILVGLAIDGWDRAVGFDPLVYGAVVGIVTAAVMSAARRVASDDRVVWLTLLAPMGFGVFAGVAGA